MSVEHPAVSEPFIHRSVSERVRSALLIAAFSAGSGASFYVASESFSNKPATISLGLVALSAVPEMYGRWQDMTNGQRRQSR